MSAVMRREARQVIQAAIARAATGSHEEARAFAMRRGWTWAIKSGVPGTESDGLDVSANARAEYVELVREKSVLGRLRGVRSVSPNVKTLRPNNSATAAWISQGRAIPAGRFDLFGFTLESKKVGALTVFSNESLQDARSENSIDSDLTRACVAALDAALLDSSNAGDDATPASIFNGVPSSASTGDPAADIAALVADFRGDILNAAFVTDKNTATRLALYRDTAGAVMFPDARLIGGEILGLPLLVSLYMPHDSSGGSIGLVDGGSIAANLEAISFRVSRDATIEQDDAPTGDSVTPTAASANLVSLFATDATAIKSVVYADWKVVRSGGVAVVTGTDY